MGPAWARPATFRLGASSLFGVLMQVGRAEDAPAAGDHPRQARRRHPLRRRDRRLHPGPHGRGRHRGAGGGLRHGGVLPGPVGAGAGRPDAGHDPVRRCARLGPAGPRPRQALDRGRRRHGEPAAGADGGGLRRLRADDLRPGPRPYRRHPRQAREHPGYDVAPDPDLFRRVVAEVGCAIIGQTARDGAGRQAALRHPRRDGHGGIPRPDHRLDPVEEASCRGSAGS